MKPLPVRSFLRHWSLRKVGHVGFFAVVLFSLFAAGYKTVIEHPAYRKWKEGTENRSRIRWSWAVSDFAEAFNNLPEKGELQFHLGAALVLDGSYSRGIYHLEKSLNNFNDRNIYIMLSHANLRLGKLAEAERNAKRALAMFPDHLTPHLLLGQIFHAQGHFAASKQALEKCIRKETHIHSQDVDQIAQEAKLLWMRWYGDFQEAGS